MSKPVTQHTRESLKARCVIKGDCWLWQGYVTNNTPQVFAHVDGKRKMVSVRKLFRELISGHPEPTGHYGYTCGNALCVAPLHTVWRQEKSHLRHMAKNRRVTPATAMRLRQARIDLGRVKIDESKAQEIRLSSESGPVLAARYGVSRSWINKIKRGQVWRDLSQGAGA